MFSIICSSNWIISPGRGWKGQECPLSHIWLDWLEAHSSCVCYMYLGWSCCMSIVQSMHATYMKHALVQWVHKFYFYFLSPVPHHLLWNTYYNNFGSWKWHEINGAIVGEVHFTWMKQHVPRVNYIVQQSTWSPCLPCRPILSTLF